ncbi:MAG: S-layer homology domain-containing protein [Thermoanaerobaculia bacterium]
MSTGNLRKLARPLTALVLFAAPTATATGGETAHPVLINSGVEQAKLTAADGAPNGAFGYAVAISGDTALVGTFGAEAAYVFTRSGGVWTQQAKLSADDGVPGAEFGISVALSGDTALVGMRGADVDGVSDRGAAYVFTRSEGVWTQQAKLIADDGASIDLFGTAVALSGNTALVGALLDDVVSSTDQGSAYVFTESGGVWSQQAKLTAADGAVADYFGVSVALDGDTALVGAFLSGNSDSGAAYVFTRGGGVWNQQAKLTAGEAAAGELGRSVALSGDTALVGARRTDVGGNADQGAAYVFTRSGDVWSRQAKLTADDGAALDQFGTSAALTGDSALVGAPNASVGENTDQGSVYLFARSGGVWTEPVKLSANDGAAGDAFGFSIAVAGDTALLGASGADVGGNTDQGAAYILTLPPIPAALDVDFSALGSDGNGVLEPDERVAAAPAWHNPRIDDVVANGILENFAGPTGATYDIVVDGASYGPIPPRETGSCRDAGTGCYELEIQLDEQDRPASHWDATVDEELEVSPDEAHAKTWTLHVGDSFSDVPRTSLFYRWIETLLHRGVTGGCAAATYCPAAASTRGQMSVFLLKALEGAAYTPPACVEGEEMFADVPASSPFCNWIEELAGRGVTAGCGDGDYCPGSPVNRDQMAVFLLKTLESPGYAPPACAGVFADVPCPSLFANWIEDLVARGITAGCGGGNYCPSNPVSRDQMAVFLSRTFCLALYGP